MNEGAKTGRVRGRLEVICGCMFSGKSELLLERLAEARARAVPVAVFKHASDDRYAEKQIVTHGGRRTAAVPITAASRMLDLAGPAQLVAVDEAQFFDDDLVETCRLLTQQGQDVVVAGLDLDSWGKPFGPVPQVASIADRVIQTHAVCSICGQRADHTQRLAPIEGQKMIGGPEAYEPRCATCFRPPPLELRR